MAYTDNFTDDDYTALEDYNAIWVTVSDAGSIEIYENGIAGNSSGDDAYYYNQVAASAHYAKLKIVATSTFGFVGPAVRVQAGGNFYYCFVGKSTSNTWVGECINGSSSDWEGFDALVVNDVAELSIDAITTTTVYYKANGTVVQTFTSKNALSGGRFGVCQGGGFGPRGDDWEAEDNHVIHVTKAGVMVETRNADKLRTTKAGVMVETRFADKLRLSKAGVMVEWVYGLKSKQSAYLKGQSSTSSSKSAFLRGQNSTGTSILDDFNRDNGALGTNWEAPLVYYGNNIEIDTNVVKKTASGDQGALWATSFEANQEAYIKLVTTSAVSEFGLLLRFGTSNFYYVGISDANSRIRIYAYDSATWPKLYEKTSVTIEEGDIWLVQLYGQLFTISRKPSGSSWTEIDTFTDSSEHVTGAGHIGFTISGTDWRGDDFGGGTLVPGSSKHAFTKGQSSANSTKSAFLHGSINTIGKTTFINGHGGDVFTAKDTYLRHWDAYYSDHNYGVSPNGIEPLKGQPDDEATHTMLLYFSLSIIPSGAVCDSATLYVYKANDAGINYPSSLYCGYILSGNSDWIEGTKDNEDAAVGEPSWNYKIYNTARWAGDTGNDGGNDAGCQVSGTDYTPITTHATNLNEAVGTEYDFAITTSVVKNWFGSDSNNYGLRLSGPTNDTSAVNPASSDHATTGYRPKLVVVYSTEGAFKYAYLKGQSSTSNTKSAFLRGCDTASSSRSRFYKEDFEGAEGALTGNWTTHNDFNAARKTGTGLGYLDISGNALSVYTGAAFSNNQYAQAKIVVLSEEVGLVIRSQGVGAAAGFIYAWFDSNGKSMLSFYDGGWNFLAQGSNGDINQGDTVRVEVKGWTYRIRVNGTTKLEWTNTDHDLYTSGSTGIGFYYYVARADDWEGGSIVDLPAYLRGAVNTSDWKSAYTNGAGTSATDSKHAYLKGQDSTLSNKHAYTRGQADAPPPYIASIRMESDLSEFTSTVTDGGDLSWSNDTTAKAVVGSNGAMKCLINDINVMYGEYKFSSGNKSGVAEVRFYFDWNSLTMADGDGFYALDMFNSSDALIARLYWRRIGSQYMMHTVMILDSTSYWGATYVLSDAPHCLEVRLKRATNSTSNDGSMVVWLDDTQVDSLTGDNYDKFYDFRYIRVGVNGADTGTSGSVYFDEIVINDTGLKIGLYPYKHAYLKGQASANASIHSYLSGQSALSSSKSVYLVGEASTSSTRHAFTLGKADTSSSKAAYLAGASAETPVSSSTDAYTKGQDISSSDKDAYLKGAYGFEIEWAVLATPESPGILVTSHVDAFMSGIADTLANVKAFTRGSISTNSLILAFVHGCVETTGLKYAYTSGQADTLDNKHAFVAGQQSVSESKHGYTCGQQDIVEAKHAFTTGWSTAESYKNAYLKGQDSADTSVDAYTSGKSDTSSHIDSYLCGKSDTSSNIDAYTSGQASTSSFKNAYLFGVILSTDSKHAYTNGYVEGTPVSDHKDAFVKGTADVVAVKAAYVCGGIIVSESKSAYTCGQSSTISNIIAYTSGQTSTADNKGAYTCGKAEADGSVGAYTRGASESSSFVSGYTRGSAITNAAVSAFTSGDATGLSAKSAFVYGKADIAVSKSAYTNGSADVVEAKHAYIHGAGIESSSIHAYSRGESSIDVNIHAFVKGAYGFEIEWAILATPPVQVVPGTDYRHAYTCGQADTLDAKHAYTNGGTAAYSSKSAFIHGASVTQTSTKSAYLSGRADVSDLKHAYTSGIAANVSVISAYTHGQAEWIGNLSAFTAGGVIASSTNKAWLSGSSLQLDYKHAFTNGFSANESTIKAFTKGLDSADSSRDAYLSGWAETSSTKHAFTLGWSHVADSKHAYTNGVSAEVTDFKHAFLVGGIASRVSAYTEGVSPAGTSQCHAYTKGQSSHSGSLKAFTSGILRDTKHAFVWGAVAVSDSKKAFTRGLTSGTSSKHAFVHGSIDVSASKSAFIKGQSDGITQKPAYTHGQDFTSAVTKVFVRGSTGSLSSQKVYVCGQANTLDSRHAYTHGKTEASASVFAYLFGAWAATSSKHAYMMGMGWDYSLDGTFIRIHELSATFINEHALSGTFIKGYECNGEFINEHDLDGEFDGEYILDGLSLS